MLTDLNLNSILRNKFSLKLCPKVINFKKIEDSTIIRIGEKYLKVIPDNPLMPIASYLELYSLAYQHPTLIANYKYQQNLLLFIDNEGHFIEAKVNFPEKSPLSLGETK